MAPATASSLPTVLTTSIALIDQFVSSLDVTSTSAPHAEPTSHPSPLHLLNAAATSLKSATTKLSLLTITAPFTSSAILSVLQPLNSSVLPSLVTATLLITTHTHPESFVKESHALTRASLRDLKQLLLQIKSRSEDKKPKSPVSEAEKKSVIESTGKVWEDCDLLLRFAKEGIPGFIARKAKQWLDLMKDAVKELEEWDPDEEDIDDQDWLGLEDDVENDAALSEEDEDEPSKQPNDSTKPSPSSEAEDSSSRALISSGVKDQALKVLSRIPQSIHVVIKQRLEKLPAPSPPTSTSTSTSSPATSHDPPLSSKRRQTLDLVLRNTRAISDTIDESAEAMYMGDLELCLRKAGEARQLTIEVVEAVLEPWDGDKTKETKEDQYIKRALLWIQQVQTTTNGNGSVSVDRSGKHKA